MAETIAYNAFNKPTYNDKLQFVNFIIQNTEDFITLNKSDIELAINIAIKDHPSFGGNILVSYLDDEIIGMAVINNTGMHGFFPNNLIIYLVTAKQYRNRGIATLIMNKILDITEGDIAINAMSDSEYSDFFKKFGMKTRSKLYHLSR